MTARGNVQEDICCDDGNRQQSLMLLLNTVNRYSGFCHAYCLMDNHYHLLIEASVPALSKEMKFLNGTFTQYFNRRHRCVGHVFQGRFKAIIGVGRCYIILNPVSARMVHTLKAWRWSISRTSGYHKYQVEGLLMTLLLLKTK